jgi:hypothetical protein
MEVIERGEALNNPNLKRKVDVPGLAKVNFTAGAQCSCMFSKTGIGDI